MKNAFMLATVLREELVDGAARRDGLKQFLQLSLWIDLERFFFETLELFLHFFENKPANRFEIAIEINRAEERFEGVAERRVALPAPAGLFPAAHQQMPAETKPRRAYFERFARNEPRPPGCQATFPRFAVTRKKVLRDDELEDGIAQELEPLIIELFFLFFMREARVGQRLGQQARILKVITNPFFERMHGRDR